MKVDCTQKNRRFFDGGWMYIIGVVFLLPRFVERRFFPGLGALFAAADARLEPF